MSIIIRLQNLPWEANSLDIRRYFQGLSIPDGGVHIVGGEKGDAFIAFSSDEDARQAMGRDGGLIKDSRVKLYLSSRNEMQKVIDQARTQTLGIKGNDSVQSSVGGGGSIGGGGGHPLVGSASHIGKQVNQPPSSLHPPNHHGPETVGPGPGMVNYPNIANHPTSYTEADLRRRSSERDIRGLGDRSRNRSRSRSPLYNRGGQVGDHLHPSSGPYNRLHSGPGGMGHLDDTRVKPDSMPGYGQVGVRSGLEGPSPSSRPTGYGGSTNLALGPNSGQNMSSGPGGGGWLSRESDNFDNRPKVPPGDPRLASAQVKPYGDPRHPSHGPAPPPPPNHGLPNFSVELRGLSFNVTPRDIQEFFRPVGVYLHEEAIKILVDDRGYTTGGAIVRCSNERDYEAALNKHASFMADRRIDVMPLPENLNEEFIRTSGNGPPMGSVGPLGPQSVGSPPIGGNGQTSGRPPVGYQPNHEPLPPQQDFVIYMKGIPYNSCTERDVADFFNGLRVVDIVFEIDGRTGKPAGNAFVEFASNEDFNSALDMNMKHMGRRYIEVFPTTREDMNEARNPIERGGHRGASSGNGSGGPTFCVNVTSLPPTITNRDLTNFFTEIGAQPFAIHIMLKPNGLNAGEAFVEFSNKDQQMKAVRKDGTFMEGQRIQVRSVQYDFMRRIVGIPPPGGQPPPGGPINNGGMEGPMRGGPMFPHGEMGGDPRKMRRGRDDGFRGRRGEKDGRRGGNDGPHPGGGNYNSFADHRCVVIASNIPYKATNEDVCVFFADFDIKHDRITRRLNDKGQATADCSIEFRSPEDAAKAVRTMHKKFLIGRPVFLRLSS